MLMRFVMEAELLETNGNRNALGVWRIVNRVHSEVSCCDILGWLEESTTPVFV